MPRKKTQHAGSEADSSALPEQIDAEGSSAADSGYESAARLREARHRDVHRAQQQERLERLSDEQRAEVRAADSSRHGRRWAGLSDEQRAEVRAADSSRHGRRWAGLSDEQQDAVRVAHRVQEEERLARLARERKEAALAARRARHRQRQAIMTELERAARRRKGREYRLRRRALRRDSLVHWGFNNPDDSDAYEALCRRPVSDFGACDVPCNCCEALHWKDEAHHTTGNHRAFAICCQYGQTRVAPSTADDQPALLMLLDSAEYRQNIRAYNSVFQMASSTANPAVLPSGVQQFRVNGTVFHRCGDLLPLDRNNHDAYEFAQVYMLQPLEAVQRRLTIMAGLNPTTVGYLEVLLRAVNPYVQQFQSARQLQEQADRSGVMPQLCVVLDDHGLSSVRNVGAATGIGEAEIGAFAPESEAAQRCVVLRVHGDGTLRYISDLHPLYHPLHYPLLFPSGTPGWQPGKGTVADFAAYHFQVRDQQFLVLQRSGRLLQEYMVDSYCQLEGQRLQYLRDHQHDLRADQYRSVYEAAATAPRETELLGRDIGRRRTVLPSTFLGGPRDMAARYADALAIVRRIARPTYFITMTCNPNWPEVRTALRHGETAADRPDVLARVFKLKLDELLHDLVHDAALGRVRAYTYVVEFQKRGLPHAHITIAVEAADVPRNADELDAVISAELPDKDKEPLLFGLATDKMLHGPCGPANPSCPCMRGGQCKGHYRKPFRDTTIIDVRGYALYRRRDDGRQFEKAMPGGRPPVIMDNRDVVPYNRALLLKFQCHLNVEFCASPRALKYLYKYLLKGHHRAQVRITLEGLDPRQAPIDEIAEYQEGRYICASEACHRCFKFEMGEMKPPVSRLPVHLEDEQGVTFEDNTPVAAVAGRGPPRTKLTAFFDLNARFPPETAPHPPIRPGLPPPQPWLYLYHEIPEHFRWDEHTGQWVQRIADMPFNMIGRMHHVSPSAGELWYLRLLLTRVTGARSYADLQRVDDEPRNSFKQAAIALHLTRDDAHIVAAMEEADTFKMPAQLRQMFALILCGGDCAAPGNIWARFKNAMSEDFQRDRLRAAGAAAELHPAVVAACEHEALYDIDHLLHQQGKALTDFRDDLPQPPPERLDDVVPAEMQRWDAARLREAVHRDRPLLNRSQRTAYNKVRAALANTPDAPRVFFLDGPGGYGKTFLLELLLAEERMAGRVALATASSGIAALLLSGGTTAHSRFGIPLDVEAGSISTIKKQSRAAQLLKAATFVVWDEVPMLHKHCYRVVDKLLQDLMDDPRPFGGKVMLLSGDFRQILPVVRHGTRAAIVAASLRRDSLWSQVHVLRLTENMRVRRALQALGPAAAASEAQFAAELLAIGDGRAPTDDLGRIEIPAERLVPGDDVHHIIDRVYGDLQQEANRSEAALIGRCIFCPKNVHAAEVNAACLDAFPGEARRYHSMDAVLDEQRADIYPTELLNSLTPSGFPPHLLDVKPGMPLLLLRNLNRDMGLANGTRLILLHAGAHVLHCRIMTGGPEFIGKEVLLPRISLNCTDPEQPVEFARRQFPVRLAMAMTINKGQGQTCQRVGVYLPEDCFSHGQLYVAASRTGDRTQLFFALPAASDGRTANVVYKEIFRNAEGEPEPPPAPPDDTSTDGE